MISSYQKIDFQGINRAALCHPEAILYQWLPDGRKEGPEWVARNPKRTDNKAGSFKINMRTGRWADFARGETGGDFISLAAYLFDLSQAEAGKKLAHMMGVSAYE